MLLEAVILKLAEPDDQSQVKHGIAPDHQKALDKFSTGYNQNSTFGGPDDENPWDWDVNGEKESLEWLINKWGKKWQTNHYLLD